MPQRRTDNGSSERASSPDGGARTSRPRRLIAGLRVSREDELLLALVAPFFPEVDSAGDLAYRLWRRGLELTLAELVALGTALPVGTSEEHLATLVAQRVTLCLPLLRRTGKLALLNLEAPAPPGVSQHGALAPDTPVIDATASATVAGLGGVDFL